MEPKGIVLDRNSRVSLQRQLEGALRDAILTGQLEAGERILSSRDLQTHLGLSRNTIVSALDQLQAEGYLVTVRGAGTFVAPTLHRRAAASPARTGAPDIVPTEAAAAFLRSQFLAVNLDRAVPFRPGIPALDLFPAAQLRREFAVSTWTPRALDYPEPLGEERLREAIAKRLHQTRGLACTAGQVLIVGGAQAGLALIARVLLKRGDAVLVEEPGYPSARAVFAAESLRLVAAPVDDAGVDVARFAKRRAALIHTTPSHQYPTGAVLSLERRLALLDWARKNESWVIEDDYDSEFNYTGNPQPALHSLDTGDRVLYLGTFSKVLSPALRLAYVVVPESLRSVFAAAQQVTGAQPSTILQLAIARMMQGGHFGRHVTKMRKVYNERRFAVASELERLLGDRIRVSDTRAGLHFIVHLPKSTPATEVSRKAAQRGLVVPPLSGYFLNEPFLNGIVVGYASTPVPEAKRAVATLAEILRAPAGSKEGTL
ncbi:MAG: PLP-dependent aminotransferase family protein [Candidatus Cybelea sp.]